MRIGVCEIRREKINSLCEMRRGEGLINYGSSAKRFSENAPKGSRDMQGCPGTCKGVPGHTKGSRDMQGRPGPQNMAWPPLRTTQKIFNLACEVAKGTRNQLIK